jgi:hypothetical protein
VGSFRYRCISGSRHRQPAGTSARRSIWSSSLRHFHRNALGAGKVKSLSPDDHCVIALCSPDGSRGITNAKCHPEKMAAKPECSPENDTFSSQIWEGGLQNCAHFSRFSALRSLRFSATQTVWRSAQSAANPSPPEFPANREKYREFARFCSRNCVRLSLSCTFCGRKQHISLKSEQGKIRTDQGIKLTDQGMIARECWSLRS